MCVCVKECKCRDRDWIGKAQRGNSGSVYPQMASRWWDCDSVLFPPPESSWHYSRGALPGQSITSSLLLLLILLMHNHHASFLVWLVGFNCHTNSFCSSARNLTHCTVKSSYDSSLPSLVSPNGVYITQMLSHFTCYRNAFVAFRLSFNTMRTQWGFLSANS